MFRCSLYFSDNSIYAISVLLPVATANSCWHNYFSLTAKNLLLSFLIFTTSIRTAFFSSKLIAYVLGELHASSALVCLSIRNSKIAAVHRKSKDVGLYYQTLNYYEFSYFDVFLVSCN